MNNGGRYAKVRREFHFDVRSIHAEGIMTDRWFTVMSGSQVRPTMSKYLYPTFVNLRYQYEQDGKIPSDWHITRDIEIQESFYRCIFSLGSNASVPQTWLDENDMAMLEHDKLASGIFEDPSGREYLGF